MAAAYTVDNWGSWGSATLSYARYTSMCKEDTDDGVTEEPAIMCGTDLNSDITQNRQVIRLSYTCGNWYGADVEKGSLEPATTTTILLL
jgi:hypothetical protein